MASIMTSIELQDRFSTVVYGMIHAVNLSISAMYDMREAVGAEFDTASLEGAKDEIDRATLAARQLGSALQDAETFDINVSAQHISQRIPVEPVFPDPLTETAALQLPVSIKIPDNEIFDNANLENFERELGRVNEQIELIARKQEEIAALAEATEIVSPDTMQKMEQIATEIETVENQMSVLARQQINLGTEKANVQMTQLKGQMQQTVQVQQSLTRAMDRMDISDVNADYVQLTENISMAQDRISQNTQEQEKFNQTINQGTVNANNLAQTIKRIAAAYISIQSLQKVIDISDQLASSRAKLDMMNDGIRTTRELQDLVFIAAERSRGSYMGMMNSVAKLGNLAKDAFASTEEVVAFSEQLNKQFILAGASTTEIQNATLQLTQALASGVLRGDELNSIFEQAPTIIQSIASYMNVPIGQIRELASEGQITADIVKNAMFAAADETNAKFASMPKTFEQIGQSIQNQLIMAFDPVFTRLNEVANSQEFQEMVDHLVQVLVVLANVIINVFELMIFVAKLIADSWTVLGPIILGAASALAVYYSWQMAVKVIEKINYGLHLMQASAMMLQAAVTGRLNKETAKQIAAQMGLNAAMYACPVMWIIMLIVALIAVIATVIVSMNKFGDESTTVAQKVCGAFAVAGAFIGNLFISVINFIIDDIVALWNYIALFANFLANVFTDPIGAVARLFAGFIDLALAGLQGLASAIDMLFGSSLAESVAGWRTDLDNWVTDKFGEGKVVMEKKNAQDYYVQGINYEDAWNKGAEFGERIDGGSSIPSMSQFGDFDYSSYLSDISDNTDDIRDGLEISEEDLKFMRDIAEQEAVNRFTTAAITIEQTNHNNVSGGMDLDGVITGLTDAVSEAADIITEGVH